MSDTICAISTPLGRGAISIVRMSGKNSLEIMRKVFSCKNLNYETITPRYLYLGYFQLAKGKEHCLAVYFKGPFSYTGEDMVEFQVHGGSVLTQSVLDKLLDNGARLAESGEFTKTKRILNITVLFWLPIYWFSIALEIFTLLRLRYVLFIFGLMAVAILLYKLFKALRKTIGNSSRLKDETKQLLKGFLVVYLVIGYTAAGIFAFTLIPKPYEKVEIRSETTSGTYTVYHDEGAPLDISEFTDIENKTVSREKTVDEAILIKQTTWTVYSVDEEEYKEVEYTITDVRFAPLLERCKNELIYNHYVFDYKKLDSDSEYEIYITSIDSERWANQFAFSSGSRIVEINFNWEPSEEELLCAAEKLMNADV